MVGDFDQYIYGDITIDILYDTICIYVIYIYIHLYHINIYIYVSKHMIYAQNELAKKETNFWNTGKTKQTNISCLIHPRVIDDFTILSTKTMEFGWGPVLPGPAFGCGHHRPVTASPRRHHLAPSRDDFWTMMINDVNEKTTCLSKFMYNIYIYMYVYVCM